MNVAAGSEELRLENGNVEIAVIIEIPDDLRKRTGGAGIELSREELCLISQVGSISSWRAKPSVGFTKIDGDRRRLVNSVRAPIHLDNVQQTIMIQVREGHFLDIVEDGRRSLKGTVPVP